MTAKEVQDALNSRSAFSEENADDTVTEEVTEEATDEGNVENEEAQAGVSRQDLQAVNAKIDQLIQSLTPKTQTEPERPKITNEMAAAFVADPTKLVEFIQRYTDQSVGKVNNSIQQQRWDSQAYKEFPTLETDTKFQDKVKSKIAELVQLGDYQKDSPRLLYVATRLAAADYRPAAQAKGKTQNINGVQGGTTAQNPQNKTVSDNDPRVRAAQMAGMSGDRLEKFKKSLPPRNAATQTKKVRIQL